MSSCTPIPGSWRRRWTRLLVVFLMAAWTMASAQAPATREYDLKAVFLFRFTSFVEWPDESTEGDVPFVIGVLGQDPFGQVLDDVIRGEKVNGRPIEVRRFSRAQEADHADLLFISRSEAARLTPILRQVEGKPVLTVSDIEHFATRGGMVEFETESGKLQLTVNPRTTETGRLKMSSKLLRLAKRVEG